MSDAKVKVAVDTSEGVQNLEKLKKKAEETKQELSSFDKAVNTAFGSKNVFQVTNFNRALDSMVDSLKTLSFVMVAANTAIITFFNAIVKELNKLQGFLSIMTLSTKSTEEANKQFDFLRGTANLLGIDLNVLTSNYAKLVAAVPDGNEKFAIAQKVFAGLAMASRTLHASTLDTQLMFYAVTQMASKGVISMEELRRQLGERLPGAMEIAARGLNTTTQALEKAIRTGSVQSTPFLKYFGDELIRTFAASADIASNTVDAALNRLKNVWVDFVRTVLESGAGQQIVGVFDALREKLADPYVMASFSAMISEIAKKVGDFVKNLSAQDVLNAFVALKTGIEAVVTITLKLIEAMNWIINNSKTVGTVIGALAGAGKGAAMGFMLGGPTGALIGAGVGGAAGAAGGYYLGSQVAPSGEESDAFARIQAEQQRQAIENKRQSGIMLQSVMGSLSAMSFSATDMSSLLPMIEKRMGFNVDTAGKFASILTDKKFRNTQERQAGALTLASTGYLLGPRGSLEETLGGGGKKGKEKKEPRLTHKDDLKEGEQYIHMLEKMMVKEEELTEVEKLWRAVAEGRVRFNSEENFLRAKTIAQKIDEANATQALMKATQGMNKEYQDTVDRLTDKYNMGKLTKDEAFKEQSLREFDQKAIEDIAKIPAHFQDARIAAFQFSEVLRVDLANSIDVIIAKTREFSYGWDKAMKDYVDSARNDSENAKTIFTTFTQGMEDAFVKFATTGKLSFKSLMDSMLAEMARVAARKTLASFFDTVLPFMKGMLGFGGGGVDLVGAGGGGGNYNWGGGFAAGGPVMGRRPIMVGENGPEIFVPNSAGSVVPNHELGGSGGGQPISITYQIGQIGSGVSRADMALAMEHTRRITMAQIADLQRRTPGRR